jgi:hypothetical protein
MAETLPPTDAIKAVPALATLLNRLASFLQKEALLFGNKWTEVQRRLDQHVAKDAYCGSLLEYLLDSLGDAVHRSEVARVVRQICQRLTSIYTTDEYPVRRLR